MEPVAILDRRMDKKGNGVEVYVLVQWENGTSKDSTWESVTELHTSAYQVLSELALPFEVSALGVMAWPRKKKGANRDQHSHDHRARSGGLWSRGLDPKKGCQS
ncbi:retrotransposable element Tf2 [Tanacetum coccineum]